MKIQRSRDWVLSQFVSEGNIVSIKNEIKKKFEAKLIEVPSFIFIIFIHHSIESDKPPLKCFEVIVAAGREHPVFIGWLEMSSTLVCPT